jgi:hypothetical protein
MAMGLFNLDEEFYKNRQGKASNDMDALRSVVGLVGQRMAEKRGLNDQTPQPVPEPARQSLNDQTPQLIQAQQNRMVPVEERLVDPLQGMNPGSTTVTDLPRNLKLREQYELANAANNGLRDDIFRTQPSGAQDATTMYNAGQTSAPIYEMDTSGIPAADDSPFRDPVNAQKLKDEVEAREKQEPGFIQKMMADPNFFPQLAISFNTLRLRPDAGLNTAMMKQIENNNATKTTNRTADYFASMGTVAGKEASDWIRAGGDPKEAMKIHREGKSAAQIVSFLENSEDYKDYAAIARENPAMAAKIYEQIIQNKLNPTAKTQTSGVQTNAANEMFVVKSQPDGTTTVVPLLNSNGEQIKGRDPTALIEAELSLKRYDADVLKGVDMAQDAMSQTYAIEGNLAVYRDALEAYADGASSGYVQNKFLPAFNDATARLRQAAISLGIQAINEATFGALSEKELQLVLSKGLDLNLKGPELQEHIIRKIDALEKLKIEITRRAAELQSMPYSEYIKKQNEITQDNMKYLKKPEGVAREIWAMFNAEARKEYYLAGEE